MEKRKNTWLLNTKRVLLFFSMLLIISSCVNHRRASLLTDVETASRQRIDNPRETTYRIQTGDQLYIKVHSLDPKTSRFFQSDVPNLMNPTYLYLNSYTVDEQGFISFSFIEKIHVEGKTIRDAQQVVQDVMKEYFNEIKVVLKLVNFQVSVMGEVSKPGTYEIQREYANLFQLLGRAGGVTQYANLKNVRIVRQTNTGSEIISIDLRETNILGQEVYHLMPNDIIYVDHRGIKTFKWGAFPYSALFSIVSTGILIYTVFGQ